MMESKAMMKSVKGLILEEGGPCIATGKECIMPEEESCSKCRVYEKYELDYYYGDQ